MPANPLNASISAPLRILDVSASLQAMPFHQQKHNGRMIGHNLPPLAHLLMAERLAELYEMAFPNHLEWLDEPIDSWYAEEAIVASVEQFLTRIGTLFPVHHELWDVDLDYVEWRLHEIPIAPMGFDIWYEEWDSLKEPAPYLIHCLYSRTENSFISSPESIAQAYPTLPLPATLDPCKLVNTLRELPLSGPLEGLPELILMLTQSTGIPWLDIGEYALADGGGYPMWSVGNIVWLAEEWQRAEPVLDRVYRLLDWKNDDEGACLCKLQATQSALLEAFHLHAN